ncbi:MAG: hypothetical protein ACSHX7_06155 [Luteolibacter sp.]
MIECVQDGSVYETCDERCGLECGGNEGGCGGDFTNLRRWGGEVFGKNEVAGAAFCSEWSREVKGESLEDLVGRKGLGGFVELSGGVLWL